MFKVYRVASAATFVNVFTQDHKINERERERERELHVIIGIPIRIHHHPQIKIHLSAIIRDKL